LPAVPVRVGAAGTPPTMRVTVVECDKVPLVPVMVSVDVPPGVEAEVVTVSVEEFVPLTEAGVKKPLAPLGKPLTPRVTVPLKPFDPVTLTV